MTWMVSATLVIGPLAALTRLMEALAELLESGIALREAQVRWRRERAESGDAAPNDDAAARR